MPGAKQRLPPFHGSEYKNVYSFAGGNIPHIYKGYFMAHLPAHGPSMGMLRFGWKELNGHGCHKSSIQIH